MENFEAIEKGYSKVVRDFNVKTNEYLEKIENHINDLTKELSKTSLAYDRAIKETPRNEDLIGSLDDKVWELGRKIEKFDEIEDTLSTVIRMLTEE